jgi:glutamyl/glutaminyl-tRNA synthetase
MKSVIQFEKECYICGRTTNLHVHHLLHGTANRKLSDKYGYCSDVKIYKENPDNYKGSIIDISMILRVALTSKSMTPDLYEIMKLLGIENIRERIERIGVC